MVLTPIQEEWKMAPKQKMVLLHQEATPQDLIEVTFLKLKMVQIPEEVVQNREYIIMIELELQKVLILDPQVLHQEWVVKIEEVNL
jgi:hypothetical protein